MRSIRYMLSLIAMLVSFIAFAQVLPDPIFGDKPATVELTIKNDSSQNVTSAIIVHRSVMEYNSQRTSLDLVKHIKGGVVYLKELLPGMTSAAKLEIRFSNTKTSGKEVSMYVLLTPGKKIKCTYDCKTNQTTFSGFMSRLCDEMTRYNKEYGGKYDWRDCLKIPYDSFRRNMVESCNNMVPDKFLKMILNNYKETEMVIASDKNVSKEFLTLWQCEMARLISDELYSYSTGYILYNHIKGQKVWEPEDRDHKIHNPFCDNGVFYLLYDVADRFKNTTYNLYVKDGACPLTVSTQRFLKAQEVINKSRYYDYLLEHDLATVKVDIPEYLPLVIDYMDRWKNIRKTFDEGPIHGHACILDRSLEGESILSGLLSKYKNGKPTFIYITKGSSIQKNDLVIAYPTEQNIDFNKVYLTGGKEADESRWNKEMLKVDGDFYYLMGYQFDYLTKDIAPRRYYIVYDAGGNEVLRGDVIRRADMQKLFGIGNSSAR